MEVTKKKEREEQGQEGKKPGIDPAIIEELMKDYQRPEDLTGPGGILEELHKRLYKRVLGAGANPLPGLRERRSTEARRRSAAGKPPQWQQQKDPDQPGGQAGDRSSTRSERRV